MRIGPLFIAEIDYNAEMEVGAGKQRVVLIATSNKGKLRDFAAVAAEHRIQIEGIPELASIPPAKEDAPTFEANASKKAQHYSRYVQGRLVVADDSGLKVDALNGAPGVHSARYAAAALGDPHANSNDEANNQRLLREMANVEESQRSAAFVCEIAAARNGQLLALFHGEVDGNILFAPRGQDGFGYDPLFFISDLHKTFAELSPQEKSSISHRGQAFRKFLSWYERNGS